MIAPLPYTGFPEVSGRHVRNADLTAVSAGLLG
jgi:hypothetical protein